MQPAGMSPGGALRSEAERGWRDGSRGARAGRRWQRGEPTRNRGGGRPPPPPLPPTELLLASKRLRPAAPPQEPLYQAPREVAHYTWPGGEPLRLDRSGLQYVVPPQGTQPDGRVAGVDLNRGFPERFVKVAEERPDDTAALVEAARAARAADPEGRGHPSLHRPDFVLWRGMLRKLLTAPYSSDDDWQFDVRLREGAVHLQEVGARPRRNDAPLADPRDLNRFQYYGYKFEALCCVDPGLERDPRALAAREDAVVDTRAQYCVVLGSKLGRHRVLIGAEVDGALPPAPGAEPSDKVADLQRRYVELKTTVDWDLLAEHRREQARRRYELGRMAETWAQCYLSGVRTVMMGFRDPGGALSRIQTLPTSSIPEMVATRYPDAWKPKVCLQFAKEVLDLLRHHVRESADGTAWRYRLVKVPGKLGELRLYDFEAGGASGRGSGAPGDDANPDVGTASVPPATESTAVEPRAIAANDR